MKPLKKQLRPITWLLAIMMIFQSCTVYKSTPLTLEQAVQKESKVKVNWENGYVSKYETIIIDNGVYYGVKKDKGENVKSPLEEKYISSIKEKNKTLSTVLSIGIPIVVVGVLVAIAASSIGGIGISGPIYFPGL